MKELNTYQELELDDGEVVKLTLTYYRIYQLKEKRKDIYKRYNEIAMNGSEEDCDHALILYTAYLCANIDNLDSCMDYETWLERLPYNRVKNNTIVYKLMTAKKNGNSANHS